MAGSIAITADDSRRYFSSHADLRLTGYPTRPELASGSRGQALAIFGLDPSLPTLLVFGGSKGARSINQGLVTILPALLAEMQVIHISGQLDWPDVLRYASAAGALCCTKAGARPGLPAKEDHRRLFEYGAP